MQAHFVALLHNLLTVLLAQLEQTGLREQKVIDKQQRRRDRQPPEQRVPTHEMIRHSFALTCQFIRAIRNCLRYKIAWGQAYPLFKLRLESYL